MLTSSSSRSAEAQHPKDISARTFGETIAHFAPVHNFSISPGYGSFVGRVSIPDIWVQTPSGLESLPLSY